MVFNLHRTDALEVNFSGIGAPVGTVALQRLTSTNITDHNETAVVVAPVELILPPFSMTVLSWTDSPPPLSSNADLSGLTLSSGTLHPVFARSTTAYSASVAHHVALLTVSPSEAQANATTQVRVNGDSYLSAGTALSLNTGANTVEILVTAENGTTQKTYSIAVTRRQAPLAQTIGFAPPATVYRSQSPLTLQASASSGLPVALSVLSAPATLVGNVLTLTAPGTVELQAVESGDGGYEAAAPAVRSMVNLEHPTSLTFIGLRQTYDGQPKAVGTDGAGPRVRGLDLGADDYLVKPFAFAELLARLRSLLRRGPLEEQPLLTAADLRLDPRLRGVTRAGRLIYLSAKEFAVLAHLLQRAGEVVTRSELAEKVWEDLQGTPSNVIEVTVYHLREKIDRGHDPALIHTVRGAGYMLKVPSR